MTNGAWLELPPAYNVTPIVYVAGAQAAVRPIISHFMGRVKPWHGARFNHDHPAKAEIEAFIPNSPWPHFLDGNPPRELVKVEPWVLPDDFSTALDRYLKETHFAKVGPAAIDP